MSDLEELRVQRRMSLTSGAKPAPFHRPSGAINFTLTDGTIIPPGPDTRFSGNVVALTMRNGEKGLNITSNTIVTKWCGEKMDNQMAVLGLLQRE